jgi:tight adherence protein B
LASTVLSSKRWFEGNLVDVTFFAVVFFFALAASLTLAMAFVRGGARRKLVRRLKQAVDQRHKVAGVVAAPRLKRVSNESRFDALIGRVLPAAENLRRELTRSGTNITIGRFAGIVVLTAVAVVIGLSWIGLPPMIVWPAAVATGVLLPRAVLGVLARRRVTEFVTQLPDAINLMARGLRSGLPIAETIAASAREVAGSVGAEFRRIAEEAQLGRPLVEVLWNAADRIDLPEFAFMVVAFSIQQETGGNLAETLDNLSQVLVRRRQMQLKVRAFTAEARSSAWIIGMLPVVVLALLSVTNRPYVAQLFTTTTGNELLAASVACIGLGVLSLTKLARLKT